jgi:D-alanyl-D-alanine endopeptidase (penicillin-binding protein 7)
MNASLFRLLPVLAALMMAGVANPALSQGAAPATAPARSQAKPPAKAPAKTTAKTAPKAAPKANSKPAKKGPVAATARTRPSVGQLAGLHDTPDELDLRSSVALVIDQETNEVLFQKNQSAVVPIASLTKLMTGIVISEAKLPLDEIITITQDDVDTEKGSGSRLRVGTRLTRGEALHLALMSSENRAAHALGRTHPEGLSAFVAMMNAKAQLLGMRATTFVEPTGLSSRNQSSAHDLALLVNAASDDATLRDYSTSHGYQLAMGKQTLQYNNTNRLVKHPEWDIGLQKTGYISEAGQCLVMQARVAGRKLIMVFLDSAGKLSRIADAERVRRWVETRGPTLPRTNTPGTRPLSS